jgi:hypothetical protein
MKFQPRERRDACHSEWHVEFQVAGEAVEGVLGREMVVYESAYRTRTLLGMYPAELMFYPSRYADN